MIKIEIYQKSNFPTNELNRHEKIDSIELTFASFLKGPERSMSLNLPSHSGSSLRVRGGNVNETRDLLTLQFAAKDLPKVSGFFSTCDPFLTISRDLSDGISQQIWKNSTIKFTNHPSWPITAIPLQLLCNGDLDNLLHLELFDWNSNGQHVSIGCTSITVRTLISKESWEMPLTSPTSASTSTSDAASASGSGLGTLVISQISLERHPTFLQYLRGGCKLAVSIGIDFTIGNGEPSDPLSYHAWDASHQTLNPYEKAITSVGSILEQYDDDKLFPVYGFGAKVRNPQTRDFSSSRTQHWFSLSQSEEEVRGVEGILELYRQSIKDLQFDQPILLKPLVDHVAKQSAAAAAGASGEQRYTILLLLTCGGISDFEATIDSIVAAAAIAPLSIIIVGIGEANFEGNQGSPPPLLSSPHASYPYRDACLGWRCSHSPVWQCCCLSRYCSIRSVCFSLPPSHTLPFSPSIPL
jgi:hypothetical protein